jgi:hypothetical protein
MDFDYTDFSDFYDCEGVAGLIGENGTVIIEEGTVPEAAGKFGDARGPFSTTNRFQRAGTAPWDTRVVAGFTAGTFLAWFRTTSNTAIQTISRQGSVAGNNEQFNLRGVWPAVGDTVDDDPAVLLIYDWALDDGTYQVGAAVRGSQGAFPLNEWCLIGFAIDLVADTSSLFLGVPGEGTYFDQRSMAGWDAFQSPISPTIVIGANNTTEPLLGLIDHITWTNGRAYEHQDFLNHWQDGDGLPREAYLEEGQQRDNFGAALIIMHASHYKDEGRRP